jgi:dethiobiotin synthase
MRFARHLQPINEVKPDLFITGTDTGVGKTLLSALLVATLRRKYWKPIQTGASEGTDRQTVMKLADASENNTYPEAYIFDPPVSPHLAAEQQGIEIDFERIHRPSSASTLIVEGAGGLLVPINSKQLMLDLIMYLKTPILIASRTTLGTINHTLLTVAAARNAGLDIRGVVMIGHENSENSRSIERYGNVPVIGSIPWLDHIDRATLVSVFKQRFDAGAFE